MSDSVKSSLKQTLKRYIPKGLLNMREECRHKSDIRSFHAQYVRALNATPAKASPARPITRILVTPPDPGALMGALGDDAMITATAEMARKRNPDVVIEILTGTETATKMAREHGLVPHNIWHDRDFIAKYDALLSTGSYDAAVSLGADIMDGYHDYLVSAKMIATVNLAAHHGIPTSLFGFSFNTKPDPSLRPFYDAVAPAANIYMRDPISQVRFAKFSARKTELVADIAFSLTPAGCDSDLESWIADRRAAGKTLLGLNLHPMLFRNASPEQVQAIIAKAVTTLRKVGEGRNLAWLMLPHDYRAGNGDGVCLRPIFEQLAAEMGPDIRYFDGRHRAAEIKAVTQQLDGIVVARMHLAIAALGMGLPPLCVTYQGKFEGLYQHFTLPDWLLMDAAGFVEGPRFCDALVRYLDQLPDLKAKVAARHSTVMALSAQNFSVFD